MSIPLRQLLAESQEPQPASPQDQQLAAQTLARRQWQASEETRAVLAELLRERDAIDARARALATASDVNDFSVRIAMTESAALTKLIEKFNEHH